MQLRAIAIQQQRVTAVILCPQMLLHHWRRSLAVLTVRGIIRRIRTTTAATATATATERLHHAAVAADAHLAPVHTVWQLTPPEPAQFRLPFTDWQCRLPAEAETPPHSSDITTKLVT